MWKYVSRRLRDTFERNVNYFDKRHTTGVVNFPGNEDKNNTCALPCGWLNSRKCWKTFRDFNDTNNKRWNFDHLNRTWIGAITWSSALVVGWYTSQLIHLRLKYWSKEYQKGCPSKNCDFPSLNPYVDKNAAYVQSISKFEKLIANVTPVVYLTSNEHNGETRKDNVNDSSSSGTNVDSDDGDLGDVLNSIENKLGLAAIENGQYQDGLNLLRSAANRNHAPAIYNLGLCYELGLGVSTDEKTAMDFYRSAAALEHPGALYNLGIYYGQGRGGLTRDVNTGTRLLRLAAVQGHRDAIEALKSLDIELVEPPKIRDHWAYQFMPFAQDDNIVPAHSTLFVENAKYQHNQNCKTGLHVKV